MNKHCERLNSMDVQYSGSPKTPNNMNTTQVFLNAKRVSFRESMIWKSMSWLWTWQFPLNMETEHGETRISLEPPCIFICQPYLHPPEYSNNIKKQVDGVVLRSCYQLSTLWLIGDTVGSLKSLWLHFFLAERLTHWTPQDLGKSFGAHIIRLFHCTVNGFPWQLWGLVLGCFSVDFGASIIMSHTYDPWRFGAFLLVQNTGRSEI